jgi:hypothetical protein
MSGDAYGHLCTVTGALWTPRGRDFDGVDDYISIPHHASLNLGSAHTIIAWVKHDATGSIEFIITKGESILEFVKLDTDIFRFQGIIGTVNYEADSTTVASTDVWYHLAGTFDGSTLAFYLNGNRESTTSVPGNLDESSLALQLGSRRAGEPLEASKLNGLLGETLIYNRVLTPLEIQHNYLATKFRYR